MNKPSMRIPMLIALLLVALASVASAGPVNCSATPSDPSCAPSLTLTAMQAGHGPVSYVATESPTYVNGQWVVA